jgi:hypothetical protein
MQAFTSPSFQAENLELDTIQVLLARKHTLKDLNALFETF